MGGVCEYLHGIAALERRPKRHQFTVHLCANAPLAQLRMNRIRKINGSSSLWQFSDIPLGSEYIDFVRKQVDLEYFQEFFAVLQLFLPFNDLLSQPKILSSLGLKTLPSLYFQCAAMPSSEILCISGVRIGSLSSPRAAP